MSIIYVKLIYDQHHFGEIETLVQDGLSQQVAQVRITISSKYGATEKHNLLKEANISPLGSI